MTTIWGGTIAAAPNEDGVMVLLPSLDGGARRHGPCGWTPRPDDVEPRRGDPCAVVEDDSGAMWVLQWRPAT